MSSGKNGPHEANFSDLLGEDVQPLVGKGAYRPVVPVKMTPGMEVRRRAAQLESSEGGNPLDSAAVIEQVDPCGILSFSCPGVQHRMFKTLRQGKYQIQSALDLHHKTVEQARQAIWSFVKDCHSHGVRCALITHGKGEGRQQPARLKSCVNHWLPQIDQVLAFHSAQRYHGGAGATYILIKKNNQFR